MAVQPPPIAVKPTAGLVVQAAHTSRPQIIRDASGRRALLQVNAGGAQLKFLDVPVRAPKATPDEEKTFRSTVHACVAEAVEFTPNLGRYFDRTHVRVLVLPDVRPYYSSIAKRLGIQVDPEDLKRLNAFTHAQQTQGGVRTTLYLPYDIVRNRGSCILRINHELIHVQRDRDAMERGLAPVTDHVESEVKTLAAGLAQVKGTIRPAWEARIVRLDAELQVAVGKESAAQLQQRRTLLQEYRDHLAQLNAALPRYEDELAWYQAKLAQRQR
jgi:hypothetical protein